MCDQGLEKVMRESQMNCANWNALKRLGSALGLLAALM